MSGIVLSLLAWITPLAACPSLAGRYVCTYPNARAQDQASQELLLITESLGDDGTVTFTHNGSPMIADGAPRPLPDDAQMRQQTLRAWCEGNERLRGELRARYYDSGNEAGDLSLNFTYVRVGANVRQITEGQLVTATRTLPLGSEVTCVRAM